MILVNLQIEIDFKINQIPHINSFNRDNKNINSNDRKIIEAANSAGIVMAFTGTRHFKH